MSLCKYTISKFDNKTKTDMIFCLNKKLEPEFNKMCLCQKYCPDKGRYIAHNQDKRHCKYFEE